MYETSKLSIEAYESVRERLQTGALALGDVISRRKLAAELGMSFLPVSEALLRLELEGFLESEPRIGTRVRIPTKEDVRGHYTVREALETQAARTFCRLATAGRKKELRRLAVRADTLSTHRNRGHYLALHERLHRRIADSAACPALTRAIAQTHSLASVWLCIPNNDGLEAIPQAHQDLVERICHPKECVAAEAMRSHIQTSLQRTMIRLAPYFRLRERMGRKFLCGEKTRVPPKNNPDRDL